MSNCLDLYNERRDYVLQRLLPGLDIENVAAKDATQAVNFVVDSFGRVEDAENAAIVEPSSSVKFASSRIAVLSTKFKCRIAEILLCSRLLLVCFH